MAKRPTKSTWNKDEILAYLNLVSSFIAYLNVERREIAQTALVEARNLIITQAEHIQSLEAHIRILELPSESRVQPEGAATLPSGEDLGGSEARHSA